MDINTKKIKKNAFRVTKVRGFTASRVRVPGGHLNAEILRKLQNCKRIWQRNGTYYIKTGFEIPGIPYELIPKITRSAAHHDALNINQPVRGEGYSLRAHEM